MTTIKAALVSTLKWVSSKAKALASGQRAISLAQTQCEDCNPCPNCGRRKVGSTKDLYQGYWSHVTFRNGSVGTDNNEYQPGPYLGVVSEEDP